MSSCFWSPRSHILGDLECSHSQKIPSMLEVSASLHSSHSIHTLVKPTAFSWQIPISLILHEGAKGKQHDSDLLRRMGCVSSDSFHASYNAGMRWSPPMFELPLWMPLNPTLGAVLQTRVTFTFSTGCPPLAKSVDLHIYWHAMIFFFFYHSRDYFKNVNFPVLVFVCKEH